MPSHQKGEVLAAVTPSWHDVAIASDVIIGALREAGYLGTRELMDRVAERLADEPLPDVASAIEGVSESDVRRVRAAASAITAIAHLDADGAILPMGPSDFHHSEWHVPYVTERIQTAYTVDGPFNYGIAQGYRLPIHEGKAPLIDSPAVFLEHVPAPMGDKVRRALFEAVSAYRRRLYLSTAILLGVASEAAWGELARTVQRATGSKKLRDEIDDPYASAAEIQRLTLEAIRNLHLKSVPLDELESTEQAYRDLRNYVVHRPGETFDEKRVARPIVGVMLEASVDYFRRLYELNARVAALSKQQPEDP